MRSRSFFKIGMLLVIVFTLLFATTGCSAEEAAATSTSTTTVKQPDTTEVPEINKFEYGADEDDIINAIGEAEIVGQNPGEYVNPITQLDGDKYDYEAGGATITCDINIDDYIQHEDVAILIDLRQMAVDAGWQVEEYEEGLPDEWIPNFTYGLPNGSYVYITLKKTLFPEAEFIEDRAETITYSIRNINGDVIVLPNRPITSIQKQSSINSEYKIIGMNLNRCAISMDEIEILAYMLSVGRIEIDQFDLVHVLGNSDFGSNGASFIIP